MWDNDPCHMCHYFNRYRKSNGYIMDLYYCNKHHEVTGEDTPGCDDYIESFRSRWSRFRFQYPLFALLVDIVLLGILFRVLGFLMEHLHQ